jgi:hypothetical protein
LHVQKIAIFVCKNLGAIAMTTRVQLDATLGLSTTAATSLLVLSVFSHSALASPVIYAVVDQGIATPLAGAYSDFNNGSIADNFVLASSHQISRLTWWGALGDASLDSFDLSIYGNSGDSPDTTLFSATSLMTGDLGIEVFNDGGTDYYKYSYDIGSGLNLAAGTYHLSVVNQDTSLNWLWLFNSELSGNSFYNLGSGWSNTTGDLAFQVWGSKPGGSVPEPELAWLLLGSVALLGISRPASRV